MSDLIPFTYDDHPVRVIKIDGEPWFVLADLCAVLDISNRGNVAARLNEADVRQTDISSGGQRRAVTIVSEPGMYEVVIRSDKPDAVSFRRWITSQVLPSIRKTGAYGTPPLPSGAELMAAALQEAASTLAAREARIASQQVHIAELEPKAEYVDTFVASEDLSVLRDVAKRLDIQEKALRDLLIQHGWIYRQEQDRWSEKQQKKVTEYRYSPMADKREYFRTIPNHEAPRFKGEVMHTLKITAPGALAIARAVKRWGTQEAMV